VLVGLGVETGRSCEMVDRTTLIQKKANPRAR